MNVRFFAGTKADYLSLPTPRNPLGLYFCADTKELFWADRLLTDGTRIVPTFTDLPSFDKAAEGITYYVEETRNGYVLSVDRTKWVQVIYAPDNGSAIKAISFAGIEMEEVDGVFTIDRRCAREALGFKVPEGMENEEIVIATEDFVKNEIEKINNPEVSLDGYATEQYVTDAIAAINPVVEEVKTKLETEVLPIVPTVQETILPTVQKVETEILPAVQELAEKAATQEWVTKQGYLTEHQSLDDYAKKVDIPSVEGFASTSYVDEAINNIEIPEVNLTGYATEQFVNEAINNVKVPDVSGFITTEEVEAKGYTTTAEMTEAIAAAVETKVDKVLFTTAKYVTNPIGSFKAGDDVRGITIAEIFAKLLGLVDEKPTEPEVPSEPTTVVEKIIAGELSMYSVTENNELATTDFSVIRLTPEEAAAAPEKSGFYQIVDNGKVIESGYQELMVLSDETYYVIAMPKILDYNTMVEMQAYDTEENLWCPYSKLPLISDQDAVAALCDEAGIDISHIDTTLYTVLALEDICTGSKLRYIIKETE